MRLPLSVVNRAHSYHPGGLACLGLGSQGYGVRVTPLQLLLLTVVPFDDHVPHRPLRASLVMVRVRVSAGLE